jgi:hypothetical protein
VIANKNLRADWDVSVASRTGRFWNSTSLLSRRGGGGLVMRQEREAEFRPSAAKLQNTRLTYAYHMVLQAQAMLF